MTNEKKNSDENAKKSGSIFSRFSRRDFGKAAIFAGVLSVIIATAKFVSPYIIPAKKMLRPPGAENERKFLNACIKCGQCVQVCPYHSVVLQDINRGIEVGSPAIIPEDRGCYLCDLLPCVLSCPSGALDHNISDAKDVNMGKALVKSVSFCFGLTGETVSDSHIARVIAHGTDSEQERELAVKLEKCAGKPCELCRDFCPYPEKDDAIIFIKKDDGYYPEIQSKCVGCGVCVELCPANPGVFEIKPN